MGVKSKCSAMATKQVVVAVPRTQYRFTWNTDEKPLKYTMCIHVQFCSVECMQLAW